MKEQKRIIQFSLVIGIVLMLAKFVAYLLTNSNAILTDAIESIVNVVASGFAFYSIHLASKPKDQNHPYGHGKVEFFSVFLEGGMIFIAGILILGKGIYNIFYPEIVVNLVEGMGIIAIAGIINFVYGTYMMIESKRLNSLTIYGDGKHLQTDAFTSLVLLGGLAAMLFTGWWWLDIVISLAMGIYIVISGYGLLRKSIAGLMDESDISLVEKIVDILQENREEDWIDVHNLRVQKYGNALHLDCHITMPNYYSLQQVHEQLNTIDQLVNASQQSETELFIHVDPCVPLCCKYCTMANCPIRSEPLHTVIPWNAANATKNEKHFSAWNQD